MNLQVYSVKTIDERCESCTLYPTVMPLVEDVFKENDVDSSIEDLLYWGTEYYKLEKHVYDRFYRLTQVSAWTETVGSETYFTAFQWTLETYGS